jgi:hypothetical protein
MSPALRSFLAVAAPLAAFALHLPHAAAQTPFPGTSAGSFTVPMGVPFEASGASWHPRLQQLFTISDNSRVARVEASGALPSVWTVAGDLEGICVADPDTDFVYVGVEHPDSVKEFDFVTGTVKRTFDLTPWMTGPSNDGLEALAFVPDPSHPEGGLFWAGLQADGRVYVFELPIKSSATATTVTHVTTFAPVPGRTDLAGLEYDAQQDAIWALYDSANRITKLSRAGAVLAEWVAPGTGQEGIATRGCELFLAEDTNFQVVRYTGFPDVAACDNLAADVARVSLAAGGTVTFTLRATDGVPPLCLYALVGSSSGTSPGFTIGLNAVHVPLNPDPYFDATLLLLNQPPFVGTFGTFGPSGIATAQFVIPAGLSPTLAGTTLHHAFLAVNPVSKGVKAASVAVALTLEA